MFVENWYRGKSLKNIINNHQSTSSKQDGLKFFFFSFVSTINKKLKTAFEKDGFTV